MRNSTYRIDQQIPVTNESEETLPLAWAGGINASQFNTIDLNGDNIEDLLLFDRMANKPIAFLRQRQSICLLRLITNRFSLPMS